MNKIIKGDSINYLTSIHEIIDPKYQFYDKKVLIIEEQSQIDFIKLIFEDVMKNDEEPECIPLIRDKMVSLLPDTLLKYFRNKIYFSKTLPRIDLIITENDNVDCIDFREIKTIFFYQTSILTEEDLKILEYIISQNKSCILIINTVFLASKFADQLLHNQINTLIFNTLYFSDYFVKFEQMIKENKGTFNKDILCSIFKDKLNKAFSH